jgi:hypothetical protein
VEANQKLQEAIQIYADAQKEYNVRLSRQRELQGEVDRLRDDFQAARAAAVRHHLAVEGALNALRQAAGAAAFLHSDNRVGVQRPVGSLVFDTTDGAPPVNLPDILTPEGVPMPLALPPAPVPSPNAPPPGSKIQALREERGALELKGHQLELEKARLFRDKNATPEDWKNFSTKVQHLAVQTAEIAIADLVRKGGSQVMDWSAMDATPMKEPPVPGKETK